MIEVKNLTKTYKIYDKPGDRIKESVFPRLYKDKIKEFNALSDINFIIEKGETVGIIGKNGSGKSTLLKILTGVINQTAGEKNMEGTVSALLELGAGFNPEYTGIENIFLNGTIMGMKKEEVEEKIDEIAEFAEIGDFINRPVKNYSSGMFVRLAFAVAINTDPDILIVDEALAVGDYRFQAKCYNKFEELKEKGKTILFVSHDVDAVRRFCSRAIWLDNGKTVMDGDVNEVTSKYMEFITSNAKSAEELFKKETEKLQSADEIPEKEFNAINRFGSDVGCIKNVRVFKNNRETEVFDSGDRMTVETVVDIPENANLENVGFALSLKNKNGLDLVVTALHDMNMRFKRTGRNVVRISLPLYLNVGEYTVTPSLERRDTVPIQYYDYIEGAAYVKVVCDKEYFGVMKVPSEITLGE